MPAHRHCAPDDSRTLTALKRLNITSARRTWERLRSGYYDKSGRGYEAAVRTRSGCLLCQKAPSPDKNGYIQIAPVVTVRTRARQGETRKPKPLPQNGHRLSVIAWHPEKAHKHLLDDGWHAGHLCGNPRCIEPTHVYVEPKGANEARKGCRDFRLSSTGTESSYDNRTSVAVAPRT
ncbi:hypothetical protein G7046_g2743 [Stylonectria norvegica]|nr:hypothetical protein G7046_g2743 [Stylonectria norvegica]